MTKVVGVAHSAIVAVVVAGVSRGVDKAYPIRKWIGQLQGAVVCIVHRKYTTIIQRVFHKIRGQKQPDSAECRMIDCVAKVVVGVVGVVNVLNVTCGNCDANI